jgi:NAD(P)-dependent dehydrogenase (short-subunit alcohol dehydrogenase family)
METKKVVIVTGAASGIGKATAVRFSQEGFALVATDIDNSGLQHLQDEVGGGEESCICIAGDLQDTNFIRELVDKTMSKWKRIDVLVNNAAWRTLETMREISIENWERTIRICLSAPAFLAKYTAACMERNKTPGVIINIGSIMSQQAGGYAAAYIACKGALESLTYELAALYGRMSIRIININPGYINTGLSGDYTDNEGNNISHQLAESIIDNTPLNRAGTAEEIANVSFWLASGEASFITGTTVTVDGGFSHNFNAYRLKKLQKPNEF